MEMDVEAVAAPSVVAVPWWGGGGGDDNNCGEGGRVSSYYTKD